MNMYVYRVTEKQDSGSVGEPGEPFEAFNLSEAKRISTRRQQVKGSVLVLARAVSRSQRRGGRKSYGLLEKRLDKTAASGDSHS